MVEPGLYVGDANKKGWYRQIRNIFEQIMIYQKHKKILKEAGPACSKGPAVNFQQGLLSNY